ncbi:bifunctional 3-(3-hydroxy-phenyl)propionate/3-hydroxycinnamic acid hydroxylase [Stagnimonas aquatica]|uniref:Bifunctional 3-(3-hydroxy-phenyl)propionate/3-hydroxycinnamic acid hydroxylase n=1 Tax=Stagnimonas aquatica TaxID=2689987 RepID=A0A3N0V2K6_9GAMM|nr:bifunctional 3-(3-hydroxy-phenyl)propionate/3-hydroxycinnamic acid hydroxylase [Stagnimonas aquatica]ROH86784.1 bifunctional 3-(3-hydroxy-phenyl)propionate/3-hydroxycinnamic acid hydroxylase [Stagnimonas aquatica]
MKEVPNAVDVLVVGYGPVGAAVAALLGGYGINTLVIDKAPDILMAPRAIALDNEALRILQMVGLGENAFPKVAIPYVRMLCPIVGEFGRVNSGGTIDGHPKLVTFYQPDLERALRKKVADRGSVQVCTSAEMLSAQEDERGFDVVIRFPSGAESTVRTRYLVGADGAGSVVRKLIGQDFEGKTYAEDWLIVDAKNVPGNFDHIEFICDPKRPTPHMVAPGGRIRWEFMLRPGETREQMESDETITRLLQPWARAGELKIERKAVYRFHARSCKRYSRGNAFLVGDAAHITPPFVGQGLVAGLRDAANLSWKLAWVLKGRMSPVALETYDQERRPHATQMIALAKLMGRLVMPSNKLMAILIHGTMALLRRIPPLRNHFDELGIKPKNEFSDGLFVKGQSRIRRGRVLPQGFVRSSSGQGLLSDDALGNGLTLVGFGQSPLPHLKATTLRKWESVGGLISQINHRGGSDDEADNVFEDLESRLLSSGQLYGWCAVVRPDRTVLHDGPISEADRLVRESIELLNPPGLRT